MVNLFPWRASRCRHRTGCTSTRGRMSRAKWIQSRSSGNTRQRHARREVSALNEVRNPTHRSANNNVRRLLVHNSNHLHCTPRRHTARTHSPFVLVRIPPRTTTRTTANGSAPHAPRSYSINLVVRHSSQTRDRHCIVHGRRPINHDINVRHPRRLHRD